jgi:hypothetical protein
MTGIRLLVAASCVALVSTATFGQLDVNARASSRSFGCGIIQRSDSPCVFLDDRAPDPVSGNSILAEGTKVELKLPKTMRAKNLTSHSWGQRVDLEVASDVVIDGHVVIAAGTEAWGSIDDSSKRPGRFFSPGALKFSVEGTRTITGTIVPLLGSFAVAGEPFYCADESCGLVILTIGPLVKGNDAIGRKGTKISAQVVESLTLDRAEIAKMPVVHKDSDELQNARAHGKGLVIVYRLEDDGCRGTKSFTGGSERPVFCGKAHIAVDENAVFTLAAGRTLQLELDPGVHRIHAPNGEETNLDVDVGSVRYVRVQLSSWKHHAQMEIVAAEAGERDSYPLGDQLEKD